MTVIYATEAYINATEGHRFGDSGKPQACYTNNTGELYRNLVREFGRCVASVWTDTAQGKALRIGWVFNKRMQYGDCDETYLREVWVTLYEQCENGKFKYHVIGK